MNEREQKKTELNNTMSTNSIITCDRCQQTIQRKWSPSQGQWTPLNSVAYWAGLDQHIQSEQVKKLKYRYLCRFCLVKWYKEEREDFFATVPKAKRDYFHRYRYNGFFNKNDILINNKSYEQRK